MRKLTHDQAAEIMLANDLEPLEPYLGTMAPWRCRHTVCGREVAPMRASLTQGQKGCKYCAGKVIDNPEQIMLDADLVPLEPYVNGITPWRCRHTVCGREVTVRRTNIAQGQGGCGHCGGNTVAENPEQVMLDADLVPLEPYVNGGYPWRCLHTVCGREVTVRRTDISSRGRRGCKYCAGKVIDNPEQVMLDAGLVPLEPYPGSSAPWRCRHTVCGREVSPHRVNIARGQGGCKYCAGKAVDDPEQIMLDADLVPLEAFPGHDVPWRCRHTVCGQEVAPSRGNVSQGGGCRHCAKGGYDLSRPGYLYVAYLPDSDITGFGITGDPPQRLATYRRDGTLTEFDAVFGGTGQEVLAFEAELKVLVRELGEVDMARPDGFKTESLAGDWVETLIARAERAGLEVQA